MAIRFQQPVIVGGGITGLTLADLWSARGQPFTLVEREGQLGGLARSLPIEGRPFDLGPHRFFSHDPEVLEFIHGVLGANLHQVERKTAIYIYNRFVNWPITGQAMWALPWSEMFRAGIDLMLRSRRPVNNFEDFVLTRYGPTLNRIFFKPMTEKFFRMPSKLIHPDWAVLSVDRAIIDKYHQVDSLYYLLSRLVRHQPAFQFLYPRQGGIQAFADRLAERIQSRKNNRLRTGLAVEGVEVENGRITALKLSNGERLPTDLLIWTGPLDLLNRFLTGQAGELSFVSTVFYYLRTRSAPPRPEQWVYVPEEAYPMIRVSFPANFEPEAGREGGGICVEVTATREDKITQEPEKLYPKILKDLIRMGILSSPEDVLHHHAAVVPESYPVYHVEYPEKLSETLLALGKISNLFLLGRGGMFWYNNMDNCIKACLEFDRWLETLPALPSGELKREWILQARHQS